METHQQTTGTSAAGNRTDGTAGIGVDPMPSGRPDVAEKADLGKRAVAMIIDSVIATVIGFIPVIGGIIGAAYIVCRDGLEFDFMRQASIGKQLMKLKPVRLDGQPMDLQTSIRRNWMFGFGAIMSVLLYIPIIGWLLMIPVGFIALALGLFEIFKVLTDPEGRRMGDNMAGTKVIEVPERVVVPR